MPVMATARPPSDFDMAKLQKSLAQRQRYSLRNSPHVAKLTPSEIRSLSNSALASKTGSQSSSKSTSSPARSRRSTNATPPTSPDDESSAYQAQTMRNSMSRHPSVNIPTPPHSPKGVRRPSQSSTHGSLYGYSHVSVQGQADGFIHAPKPRTSAQAAFMSANGLSSRPSSSGSSVYRGLPTYRGPEVTRTGSMNMLQRPSQTIVTNPLSYFSRPRQSIVSTSPERSRGSSPQDQSNHYAQTLRNDSANMPPTVSLVSSRPPSPPRMTDSPVSMMDEETEKFPILDPAEDPHNQPKIQSDEEDVQHDPVPPSDEQIKGVPASTVETAKPADQPESPKKEKDRHKRFTISSALFGGEKAGGESTGKLKKTRRRTLSFTASKEAEKAENSESKDMPIESKDTPTESTQAVQVDGATLEDVDFTTHPAVRPLSLVIPPDSKGKEKEIHSAPVYARCSCCGKLKRPPGYTSELSPVMENENLRANFSFEIERTSGSGERRDSDSSRHKFTPILPMEVGKNETRQATIEPLPTPSPVKARSLPTTPTARRPKRHSDPPRFVRFGSLHGRRNTDPTIIAEEDEEQPDLDENQPLMSEEDTAEDTTVQTIDFAAIDEIVASSRPILETSEDRVVLEPMYENQPLMAGPFDEVPHRPSNADSGSDLFFTPARGTTPVVESLHQGEERESEPKATTPIYTDGIFLGLPDLTLGPDFTRRDSKLRDLVLEMGTTTSMANDSAVDLNATVAGMDNEMMQNHVHETAVTVKT